MSAASLTQLPNEVLLMLVELLPDAGINALVQTCHHFHYTLESTLYVRNARHRNSSALQWAARYGMLSTVRKALAAGADPNSWRRRPHNPHPDNFLDDIYRPSPLRDVPFNDSLTTAVVIGRPDIVITLLKAGASVGIGPGGVPLVSAIQNNRLEMIQLLTASRHLHIDSPLYLRGGYNLLSIAVWQASVHIVCYLLAAMKQPDTFSSRLPTPLIVAIQKRVSMIPLLLGSPKIDPNKPDRDGRTPLMWAVKGTAATSASAQLLLSSERVDVNAVDRAGRTAIFLAAESGNEHMVRLLLATPRVDPNLADNGGMEPVARALEQGHKSVAEVLMASDRVKAHTGTLFRLACQHTLTGMIRGLLKLDGAEQSTTDADGSTWLHTAASYGRTDIVKLLLKQKHVNINQQRSDGATALVCALQKKRNATVTVLLQAGADVNIAMTNGRSALFFAAENSSELLAEELLNRGSSVGAVTNAGETALYQACRTGRTKNAQILLKHGADPLLLANNGRAPLHAACAFRWEQAVDLLLSVIPRSHPILSTGRTPLHDACQAGHTSIAKKLVEHGADPVATLHDGTTPLEYACNGHPLIVKMLLEKGADPHQVTSAGVSLLYQAVLKGSPRVAALLLQHGANPNAPEIGGTTAFLKAASRDEETLLRTLLKYGADATSVKSDGSTALHEVCCAAYDFNSSVTIKALLEKGADINARTHQGLTPLHLACLNRKTEHVVPLTVLGANPLVAHVDPTTSRHRTAVHMACRFPPDTDDLGFLLENGRFNVRFASLWKSGWTPLHEAATAAHPAAVKLLLKRGLNPMALAEHGQTALHQVFSNGQLHQPESQKRAGEVIIALMETGKMDINHRDIDGKTVLKVAGSAPEPLRTLLVKWGAKE